MAAAFASHSVEGLSGMFRLSELCQAQKNKKFRFTRIPISVITRPSRTLRRGDAHRHVSWARDAMDGGLRPGSLLPDETLARVRRSRVVLAPRPWRLSAPACAGAATVTKSAAHRGEHEVSRKAIARGKPGCLGCTCLIRVRCCLFAHGAAGAVSARLSLRPLRFRGTTNWQSSGKIAP